MTLSEAFEGKTVEQLNRYVAALRRVTGAPKPEGTRKAQMIAHLVDELSRAEVARTIWEALDPLERRFVSQAVADGGAIELGAFTAQYEALPASFLASRSGRYVHRRKLAPLELLFHRESYGFSFAPRRIRTVLPDELLAVLAPIAPAPERFALTGSEELPARPFDPRGRAAGQEALPLLRADTERSGWHDLRAYLGLVRSGTLTRSAKTGDPTAASVRKLLATLLEGDLLNLGTSLRDSVRPYGLDAFARGAELVQDDGALSPRGQAVLAGDAEALLEGFEQWSEGSILDEFARVRGIKGQSGRRADLTLPFERRERVVEALSWCPTGVWIPVADFQRAILAWRFDFEIEDTFHEGPLYIGDRTYGDLDQFPVGRRWALVQGSYVDTLLFEVLAPVGALDVAYLPPTEVDAGAGDLLGRDDILGLGTGLLYFRINPLGAFLFGQADDWAPPRDHALEPGPDLWLRVRGRLTPELRQRLLEIALPVTEGEGAAEGEEDAEGEGRYRLDTATLLASLEGNLTLDDVREFLRDATQGALPPDMEVWLETVGRDSQALATLGRAVILKVRSPAAMEAIRREPKLMRAVHAIAGDTVVIPARNEARFRRMLRESGFGISS